jgi:hypothetical protein
VIYPELAEELGYIAPLKRVHGRVRSVVGVYNVARWIDWLVKDGKLKPGQLKPTDVYTNAFNPFQHEI